MRPFDKTFFLYLIPLIVIHVTAFVFTVYYVSITKVFYETAPLAQTTLTLGPVAIFISAALLIIIMLAENQFNALAERELAFSALLCVSLYDLVSDLILLVPTTYFIQTYVPSLLALSGMLLLSWRIVGKLMDENERLKGARP